MLFIRSLLFAIGMWLSIVVIAVLSIFIFPFPFVIRYGFISQWARFTLWWLKLTCSLDYEVEGLENIPATNSVILCKHQSTWETLALQKIFPLQVWLLKRELLWVPFFGWALALLEPIAIDRKVGRKAIRQLLEQGEKRLKDGRWVVIFPEGTRTAPGEKRKYASGGAALAERAGCPVVPVAHNAGEFWPRRGFFKRPGRIRVCIGPAIDSNGKTAAEINALAESWIEDMMKEISCL